jgi:hypothetical protein
MLYFVTFFFFLATSRIETVFCIIREDLCIRSQQLVLLCLTVHPSVLVERISSRLVGFVLNLIVEHFSKICREHSSFVKMRQEQRALYMCIFVIASRWTILRMRNVSGKSCGENQNNRFMFNITFFRKSCRLWVNVEKYGTGHRWLYNTA